MPHSIENTPTPAARHDSKEQQCQDTAQLGRKCSRISGNPDFPLHVNPSSDLAFMSPLAYCHTFDYLI